MRVIPKGATVYGIDLGKNTFHFVGMDEKGVPVQKAKLSRKTIFRYFEAADKALIGMEACPGSQWLARKLIELGHDVKIIPAQFVKPFVKSTKNDTLDAEAIAEAVTRPTMRFVKIRTSAQIDMQALHRIRSRLVSGKTRLVNQMRALCQECGVVMPEGVNAFQRNIEPVISDQDNDLTTHMRRIMTDLVTELNSTSIRINEVTREIEAAAARDEMARKLITIPGIGSLGATALLAAVGDGKQFHKARDFAAWLGLVPRQYSTGGKSTLLGISKRGNSYVRRLIIHGARACLIHMKAARDRFGEWIEKLRARMHPNKVVVALANKIARIAWVILTKPGVTYERVDPAYS
jgi:transposase